jgi:hypothetical protein
VSSVVELDKDHNIYPTFALQKRQMGAGGNVFELYPGAAHFEFLPGC